jgi:hypothetical protein
VLLQDGLKCARDHAGYEPLGVLVGGDGDDGGGGGESTTTTTNFPERPPIPDWVFS